MEIRDHDAEIPDVALLGIQELLDDHSALEEVFDLAAYEGTGEHAADEGLDFSGCVMGSGIIIELHCYYYDDKHYQKWGGGDSDWSWK